MGEISKAGSPQMGAAEKLILANSCHHWLFITQEASTPTWLPQHFAGPQVHPEPGLQSPHGLGAAPLPGFPGTRWQAQF